MLRLILHGIARRRWQSLATLLGVAFGVSLLFAVLLLEHGIERGIERGRQRLGADLMLIPFHARVDAEDALFSGSPMNTYMDRKWAGVVRAIPGVQRVDAQFFTQTLTLECCAVGEEIRLVGIEPDSVGRYASMSPDGTASLAPNEIIVGGRLISRLGWKGSMVELLGDVFKIGFELESTGTGLDESILMPIDSARRLAAASSTLQPLWKDSGNPSQLVSVLLVSVDKDANVDAVAERLGRIGSLRVVRPAEAFERIRRLVHTLATLVSIGALLAAAVGLLYLTSHIASAAWDRKAEWALYRALGATRGRLVLLVIGEALALSLAGAGAGLPVGIGLYRLALVQLLSRSAFPFVTPPAGFIVLVSVAALATYASLGILAALGAALKISRLDPSRVLAEGDIDA